MNQQRTAPSKPILVALVGAFVSVLGALVAIVTIGAATGGSPVVLGLGIGVAAILVVLLGVIIGLMKPPRGRS